MLKKLKINTEIPNSKKNTIRAKLFTGLGKYPNLLIIYKAIAMIMVWSGIWGLMDIFIFPDNPTVRYFLIFFIGIFLLYIDDGSVDELIGTTPTQNHHEEQEHQESEENETDSEREKK